MTTWEDNFKTNAVRLAEDVPVSEQSRLLLFHPSQLRGENAKFKEVSDSETLTQPCRALTADDVTTGRIHYVEH